MAAASLLTGTPAFVPCQSFSFNQLNLTGTGAPQVIFTGPPLNEGEVWMVSFQASVGTGTPEDFSASAYGYGVYVGTTSLTSVVGSVFKGVGEDPNTTVTITVPSNVQCLITNFVFYRIA